MEVFENVKLANLANLQIDVSALYLIAAPKTRLYSLSTVHIKRADDASRRTRSA
jgi:hypothetical protein